MTVFTQSFGGSISGTGAPTKLPKKKVQGSVTPTGRYQANRMTFPGSITMSGALALRVNKSFAGRIFAAGSESPTVAGGGAQTVESGGNTGAVGGLLRGPT